MPKRPVQLGLRLVTIPADVSPETLEEFNKFWAVYPRRVGKKPAIREWLRLRPDAPLIERIMDGALQYALSVEGKEKKYIKHAASWLHDERWEDEMEVEPRPLCAFCRCASDNMAVSESGAVHICLECAAQAVDLMRSSSVGRARDC